MAVNSKLLRKCPWLNCLFLPRRPAAQSCIHVTVLPAPSMSYTSFSLYIPGWPACSILVNLAVSWAQTDSNSTLNILCYYTTTIFFLKETEYRKKIKFVFFSPLLKEIQAHLDFVFFANWF